MTPRMWTLLWHSRLPLAYGRVKSLRCLRVPPHPLPRRSSRWTRALTRRHAMPWSERASKVPASRKAVAVPVSALRKGSEGVQVFVIAQGQDGRARAHVQQVESGAMFGDEVVIHAGLIAGEQVAASGSFKLRESALVAIAGAQTPQSAQRQTVSQH